MIDTGRHVYTNWQPILAKRSFDRRLDPYAWALRSFEYGPDTCPVTLDILSRTRTVELAPELPTPAFRLAARQLTS